MIKFLILAVLVAVCSARNAFPDKTDDNFQNECLQATNQRRGQHKDTPSLKIDQSIVAYAKERCRTRSMGKGLSLGHSGLKGHGENLFWGATTGSGLNGCKSAIDSWYNEIKDYNYNSPGFSSKTGHFTQLIWKGTTLMGCARCGGKEAGSQWTETYIACNYKPPGNVNTADYFRKNVMPKK